MIRLRMKGNVALVDITDVIGMGGYYADDLRASLAGQKKVSQITVRLSSDGGDILEGLAVFNTLKQHPARVRVEIIGVAASMASVIAMAGDEIAMAENSYMMIHNPAGGIDGESEDLRSRADLLDSMRDMAAKIYAARTGQKLTAVIKAMAKETWMTAAEALSLGYATEIIPATKMVAQVTRRFKNQPRAVRRAKVQGKSDMDLEQLIELLGLPDDSTAEDVQKAIEVLQQKASASEEGDDSGDDDSEAEDSDDSDPEASDDEADDDKKPEQRASARGRRPARAQAKPKTRTRATNRAEMRGALRDNASASLVSVLARLEKKIDRVGSRVDGSERENLMSANAHKFTPKMEKVARNWDMKTLREYIANASDVSEPLEQEEETEARGGARMGRREKLDYTKLTSEEMAVARLTGQDPDRLLAFKKNGLKLVAGSSK